MKNITRTLLLLIFIFESTLLLAQAPPIQWARSLGGSENDDGFTVQHLRDGGYIVAGQTQSFNGNVNGNHGDNDMWVVRLDANGNIKWQTPLGGIADETAFGVQQTTDGGFILAGQASSFNGQVQGNHGGVDVWVVKLDSSGNLVWAKALGGSNTDDATSVQQTADGGYIVAGTSSSNDGQVTGHHGPTFTTDVWVVKLDASGNIVWEQSYGGSNSDFASSVRQTRDGGYIVAGNTTSKDGDVTNVHDTVYGDMWILKLDASGNIAWEKTYGGSDYDFANSIRQTSDDGYIVAGFSRSNNGDVTNAHGDYDFWVLKLTSNGNLTWQKALGGTGADLGYGVEITSEGNYIVGGGSISNDDDVSGNHGLEDFWINKLDGNGNLIWQTSLGGSSYEECRGIDVTNDGGVIATGFTMSNNAQVSGNHGRYDVWVVRLQGCACDAPSSGFSATKITATTAKLNWSTLSCALGYKVQYRPSGTTAWTTVKVNKNMGSKKIMGLTASTMYEWQVASLCAKNPNTYSTFSAIQTFTTLSAKEENSLLTDKTDAIDISISPNPTADFININLSGEQSDLVLQVMNMTGQVVIEKRIPEIAGSYTQQLDVTSLPSGLYYVCVKSGNSFVSRKFVKE